MHAPQIPYPITCLLLQYNSFSDWNVQPSGPSGQSLAWFLFPQKSGRINYRINVVWAILKGLFKIVRK